MSISLVQKEMCNLPEKQNKIKTVAKETYMVSNYGKGVHQKISLFYIVL